MSEKDGRTNDDFKQLEEFIHSRELEHGISKERSYSNSLSIEMLEKMLEDENVRICPLDELASLIKYLRSDEFNSSLGITSQEITMLGGSRVKGHYLSQSKWDESIQQVYSSDRKIQAKLRALYSFFNAEARRLGVSKDNLNILVEEYSQFKFLKPLLQSKIVADFDIYNSSATVQIGIRGKIVKPVPGSRSTIDFHPTYV